MVTSRQIKVTQPIESLKDRIYPSQIKQLRFDIDNIDAYCILKAINNVDFLLYQNFPYLTTQGVAKYFGVNVRYFNNTIQRAKQYFKSELQTIRTQLLEAGGYERTADSSYSVTIWEPNAITKVSFLIDSNIASQIRNEMIPYVELIKLEDIQTKNNNRAELLEFFNKNIHKVSPGNQEQAYMFLHDYNLDGLAISSEYLKLVLTRKEG